MKTESIPSPKLPRYAELLPRPKKLKISGWNELIYDAKLVHKGITWYRVHGGFGAYPSPGSGNSPRYTEDWIADTPGIGVGLSESKWKRKLDSFGRSRKYSTLIAAMEGEIAGHTSWAEDSQAKYEAKLAEITQTLARMREANT